MKFDKPILEEAPSPQFSPHKKVELKGKKKGNKKQKIKIANLKEDKKLSK